MTVCTSPCFPKCAAPATFTLRTLSTKGFLGHNCAVHIPKTSAKDYLIEPIVQTPVEPTP